MEEKLLTIRHSLSHLLAAAVLEMFPEAKLGIGPAIENGFYYDFDLPRTLIPEDLPILEEKMRALVKKDLEFQKYAEPTEKAVGFWEKAKQPYKVELAQELVKEEKEVLFYRSGDFVDLCEGPHIKSTKEISADAFRLDKIAGAYWRGSEKNKMLRRIYGLAFESKEKLNEYLKNREEAEKRDHRKIGKELDLFVFSDLIGKGLPLFTSKGATIKRELEHFVVDEEIKRGYEHIITPHLAKVDLYRTSGHYPYYKDTMYPTMKIDEDELILRPMTCPHHFMLYKSKPRSYKELPLKFAELASQFRYEKSGELTGLTRVRAFCLADAHIFAAVEQAKEVISDVLNLIEYANDVFGLKKGDDYRYRLSLGDRHDNKKYYKDDAAWNKAEKILRSLLKEKKELFFEAPGEAAFYGPKIDIQMKKAGGAEETAFTVQYDFVMPKRFDLKYIDDDGKEKQPIVIHRSSIGAIERTMAFLIEHFAGAFPVWLAPVQVIIIPVSEKFEKYGQKIYENLKKNGVRVEIDNSNESVSKRIRNGEIQKVSYILVTGEKEEKDETVAVRERGKKEVYPAKIDKFIKELNNKITTRA